MVASTWLESALFTSTPHAPQVLRANKESILTVIEVFIHDPLYKWALTTTAANRRQHGGAGGGAADEVRAGRPGPAAEWVCGCSQGRPSCRGLPAALIGPPRITCIAPPHLPTYLTRWMMAAARRVVQAARVQARASTWPTPMPSARCCASSRSWRGWRRVSGHALEWLTGQQVAGGVS